MKTGWFISILSVLAVVPAALSCHSPNVGLTRARAEEIAAEVWQQKLTRIEADYGAMWDAQVLTLRNLRMPLHTAIYGTEPADGRSLYISMHGGGAAPAATNDEQWENQKTLYAPAEEVYVAPRAAIDRYDMWSQPSLDTLFPMIIRMAVARHEVNPNKVYLTGYSAGGDGVFRMAPRMADHWAAAAQYTLRTKAVAAVVPITGIRFVTYRPLRQI